MARGLRAPRLTQSPLPSCGKPSLNASPAAGLRGIMTWALNSRLARHFLFAGCRPNQHCPQALCSKLRISSAPSIAVYSRAVPPDHSLKMYFGACIFRDTNKVLLIMLYQRPYHMTCHAEPQAKHLIAAKRASSLPPTLPAGASEDSSLRMTKSQNIRPLVLYRPTHDCGCAGASM